MKRRVYFRADTGPGIGYGHFVRSLALASMLKDNFDCRFFSAEPTLWQYSLASTVCPLEPLPSGEARFGTFLDSLDGGEIVVLDNYFFTPEYQLKIKEKRCKLVCIDDLHDRYFHCDLLLSPCSDNASAYEMDDGTFIACGPSYALVGEAFREPSQGVTRDGVFISFGGSDPEALTLRFARLIRESYPETRIDAVVGDGFPALRELSEIPGVSVHHNVSPAEMASLMRSSRIAVCSASGTCYEALACGCDVYAGYYVDNQKAFYEMLCRRDLVHPLDNLLRDSVDLNTPAPSGSISFDGVEKRFVNLFRGLSLDIVPYTALTPEQSRMVWETRNLPEIRCRMTNPEPFSFESHCAFVEGLKRHPDREYYAFFDGDELEGTYDFVDIIDGRSADRGLFVAPGRQHSGVGAAMERLMETRIARRGVRVLTACVLKDNPASLAFHQSVGYCVESSDDRFYYLCKELQ
ncbi:MAG: GNAT family N-acetyltransferase [Bacteroidales bacterium]|nr:GNAT family N-acetyltransferase [Bacteroidales bacterium]